MKKILAVIGAWAVCNGCFAQTVSQKLQKAFQQFENDSQLKHAISSLYVIDAATGQVVFDKNSQIGLAPASTQKIITATTAFELLGKDYRYKTELGYEGDIGKGVLNGSIIILGSGDPTFGSWRWQGTTEEKIIGTFAREIKNLNIKNITGSIEVYNKDWESLNAPDGWIVQDIGNYYGAGASFVNWRENQFDVFLKSGNTIGDSVKIIGYTPRLYNSGYVSELVSAKKGSGDNAYIYRTPKVIRGTIPVNENKFMISGSIENPAGQFAQGLSDTLMAGGINLNKTGQREYKFNLEHTKFKYTHYSPSLDSIIYWFLKKSINLYGEALIKTFACQKQGYGSTDSGVAIVQKFWKDKGLDETELNIYDGSGLSPLNRVTTHAQAEVLKFAKTKIWFPYFYDALPEYNGMKMKSGTIGDVKGFCGYQKSKAGKEYIFSFLVNNYNGKASGLVNKMYKVLDELK